MEEMDLEYGYFKTRLETEFLQIILSVILLKLHLLLICEN